MAEEKKTAYEKGRKFEKQVASWAERFFEQPGAKITVRQNVKAHGTKVKEPYQIDVLVHARGKGLFAPRGDIWIECKWKEKEKSPVKRTDIQKLVMSAQDVYRAGRAGKEEISLVGLMLVSNQRFNDDALRLADQMGVLCARGGVRVFEQQNEAKDWVGEPAWLKQVK